MIKNFPRAPQTDSIRGHKSLVVAYLGKAFHIPVKNMSYNA